jgi:hypothetical protein
MNRKAIVSTLSASLLVRLLIASPAYAGAPDQMLPPMGGPGGGQFFARCSPGDVLNGVELRVGDDVDAIRPLCLTARGPTGGDRHDYNRVFGGDGGRVFRLECPPEAPTVAGIDVAYEGETTVIINNVHLFCGRTLPNEGLTIYPTAVFDGPAIGEVADPIFVGGRKIYLLKARAVCPSRLLAVGINGRSGKWLDAVSLICGAPPFDPAPPPAPPPPAPVKSIGRVNRGTVARKSLDVHTICDAARDALARQSPASPNLVTQCRAAGGNATAGPNNIDLENIRARGEVLAAADASAGLLSSQLPEVDRRGFEIGLGIWEGNTAPGPGKQRYHDSLIAAEQRGFDLAASYALPRNKYDALVKVGLAIAAADANLNNTRMAGNNAFYWLGCDIAGGLFGDPAAGAQGISDLDAGAIAIRTSLNDEAARRGFNTCMALNLSRTQQ